MARDWKAPQIWKYTSNSSVLSITYECLTNFQSFVYFDHDSIKPLSKSYSKNIDVVVADVPNGIAAKKAVPGKNISTISICQLVVATNAVMYYIEIRRMHDFYNMH